MYHVAKKPQPSGVQVAPSSYLAGFSEKLNIKTDLNEILTFPDVVGFRPNGRRSVTGTVREPEGLHFPIYFQ